MVIFNNDMFEDIAKVTKELWPEMPWPCIRWSDAKFLGGFDGQFFGSEKPLIYISTSLSIKSAVIVLSHELAHAVTYHLGRDYEAHGPKWQDYYDKINKRYNEVASD